MKVKIYEETSKDPLKLIGKMAGVCWGANTEDDEKNYKRGLSCLKNDHGRTLEFPQIYFVIEGGSARFMRELYTHIGGSPTRLQASTRYINYQKGFDYIIPDSIREDEEKTKIYEETMDAILKGMQKLRDLDVPREDVANLLPLGMESKMVMRTNLRMLIDMSRQRMCMRAYWEFRDFMDLLIEELSAYDEEYKEVIDIAFGPKCDPLKYCPEEKSCGRWPTKDDQ